MKTRLLTAAAFLAGVQLSASFAFEGTGVYTGVGAGQDSIIVYTMNFGTGTITRLWGGTGTPTFPGGTAQADAFLTADGTQIVFSCNNNLYIMNNDGTGLRTVGSLGPHGSWCVTAKGVFYFTPPVDVQAPGADHQWKLHHVNLTTGAQRHLYTFDMPICELTYGTDICMSQDASKLFTRADMIRPGDPSDCTHADNAFMTLNPDLTVARLDRAYQWGHGSAVSRDGRYVFHIGWGYLGEIDGREVGYHQYFDIFTFDDRAGAGRIISNNTGNYPANASYSFCQRPPAICQNSDSLIGADVFGCYCNGGGVESDPHSIIIHWPGDGSQEEVQHTPPYSRFGNFWKGPLPQIPQTPVIEIDKAELVFNYVSGAVAAQTVTVANSGVGTLSAVSTSRLHGASWLSVSVSGSSPQVITNTIATTGLLAGTYVDTVEVSGGGAGNTVRYKVTLNVNTLPGPTSLTAIPAGDSLLDAQLSWIDNASDEGGYAIYRSPDAGASWSEIHRTPANETSYLDVRPGRDNAVTSYDYRVAAFKGNAYSAYSNATHADLGGRPWIVVTSPAAGDVWRPGAVHTIRWSANRVAGVKISYSLTSGRHWNWAHDASVESGSSQWGSLPWTVVDTPSTQAYIKVEEYGGTGTEGLSGMFTISNAVPVIDTIDDAITGTGDNQFEFVDFTYQGLGGGDTYRGTQSSTTTPDAYYQVRFVGTKIDVYAMKYKELGIGAYSVDGGPEIMVDQYAPDYQFQQLMWSSGTLALGNHTLRVRCTGTKNARADAAGLQVDHVVIADSGLPSATADGSESILDPHRSLLNSIQVVRAGGGTRVTVSGMPHLARVSIVNVAGRIVASTDANRMEASVQIPNAGVGGICIVRIESSGQVLTQPIVLR